MSNNVSISMSAKDGDVIKAWDRIINQNERLIRRLEKTEQTTRKGKTETLSLSRAWSSMISPLKSAAAGVMSIGTAFAFVRSENAKLRREVDDASKSFDALFRDIQIQTGLRGQDAEIAKERVIEAAYETPVSEDPLNFAAKAAKQLASSGFSPEEATGASLREFLKVLSASTLQDQPEETAQAIGQYLKSNNLEKNSKNLSEAGRAVQKLFLTTDVQLSDLSALAKEAASFSTQMNMPEQLGTFSVLREVQQPEQAATGLRNIVGRLSTASASNTKVDLLDQLGLKPEDIDFIGEDVLTVLERFKKGIDSVDETKRAPILKQLFEEQGVASARVLLENIDLIKDRIEDIRNNADFEETVRVATSGETAAVRRQKVVDDAYKADSQDYTTLLFNEIEIQLRKRGLEESRISLLRSEMDLLKDSGMSRDNAADAVIPFGLGDVAHDAKVSLARKLGTDTNAKRRLGSPSQRAQDEARVKSIKRDERRKEGKSIIDEPPTGRRLSSVDTPQNITVAVSQPTQQEPPGNGDQETKTLLKEMLAESREGNRLLRDQQGSRLGTPKPRPSRLLSREWNEAIG